MYGSLYFPIVYLTLSHFRYTLFSMLSEFRSDLVSLPFCMVFYVVWVFTSLGLTSVMYGSLCYPSFYITWSHSRSGYISMLSEFLRHLVSLQLCMGCVVWVSMSPGLTPLCMSLNVIWVSTSLSLTSVMNGFLCCLSFYVTWSHFCSYVSLCCLSFYVTWSHFRYVWVVVLAGFLCRLVSLRSLWVLMLSESLCWSSLYVTWFHFRYVWVSMFFVVKSFCHLVSLPSCVAVCCQSFYVTWSHFRSVWFSTLSDLHYLFCFICSRLCYLLWQIFPF